MSSSNQTGWSLLSTTSAIIGGAATAAYLYYQQNQQSTGISKPALLPYERYVIDYMMHVEQRQRVLAAMRRKLKSEVNSAVIMIDGGDDVPKYDTDTVHEYYQESFFQHLFGAHEPGNWRGVIDLVTGESFLFIPRYSEEWELWCGPRLDLEQIAQKYKVNQCFYLDETAAVLTERKIAFVYRLSGQNLDSGMTTTTTSEFPGIDHFTLNDSILFPILVEIRVTKTEKELALMKYINSVSSRAHMEVMKTMQPQLYEFHAESTFNHSCYCMAGARLHAYTCICGSGSNASVLHYGHSGAPNEKQLQDGDIFLNDMGCSLHGYASDITCSYPVNGTFSIDQRMIYEGVLASHDGVIAAMKSGVDMKDLHLLSHTIFCTYFLEKKFFHSATVEELLAMEISAYFYPHGLGHMMGLDVHDCGGYLPGTGKDTSSKMFQKLRCGRVLGENMVVTVEPGWYFIEAQLNELMGHPKLKSFVNLDMLERFRGQKFGGIRIESDIIIREHGCENMTKVPRTIDEIQQHMKHA